MCKPCAWLDTQIDEQNKEFRNKATSGYGELQFKTEKLVCEQTVLGQTDTHTEKTNFNSNLTAHTKMNSEWTNDRSKKTKTIKLLEKKFVTLEQTKTS